MSLMKKKPPPPSPEMAQTFSFLILVQRFSRLPGLLTAECQEVVEVFLSAHPTLAEFERFCPGFRELAVSLREAQRLGDAERTAAVAAVMEETLYRIQSLPVEDWFEYHNWPARSRVGPH